MADTELATASNSLGAVRDIPQIAAAAVGLTLSNSKKLMQYDANKKSTLVGYLLLFLLGGLGAHRFYLGQTGTGVALLLLTISGFLLSVIFVGFFLLMASGIWVLVDIFLLPGMVRRFNNGLIRSLS